MFVLEEDMCDLVSPFLLELLAVLLIRVARWLPRVDLAHSSRYVISYAQLL